MRAAILAFFLLPLAASAANAAPTCLDQRGDTVRCGTSGAMPAGWKPSERQLWDWQINRPAGPDPKALAEAIAGIALLLALIALMPDFEGWNDDRDGPGRR